MVRHAYPPENLAQGSDQPRRAGAKVAPCAPKIKRRERFKGAAETGLPPNALILLPPLFSGQKFFCDGPGAFRRLRTGRPVAAAKVEAAGIYACLGAHRGELAVAYQPFEHIEQSGAYALPGKFGCHIQALQHVAANGSPSGDDAIELGDPYFQLTQLALHS